MYPRFLKRFFDMTTAAVLLVLLSPLLLLIALAVRWRLGSPVLFAQTRVGRDERLFTLYKFRSMRDTRDAQGNLTHPEERVTRLGRLLRRSSLDELPELYNILRGDMSLIGPRPLLKEYIPLYSPEQRRRHSVRPGLTGWAQVNGRNSIAWRDKFSLDLWYIDHMSFRLDCRIVLLTIKKVLAGDDISQKGKATVERFNGSN